MTRIAAPSGEVFVRDYLRKQQPVILEGLFDGQPIADVRTEEAARAAFGSVQIAVDNEYLSGIRERQQKDRVQSSAGMMTIAGYLDYVREHPGTRRMCSEKPTPPEVIQTFKLPPYDNYEDAVTSVFVGNEGNFAHMHFDGDYRHVMFYQVFGTKRFILVPPSEGRKLHAIGNNALWCLEHFSEADKRSFLDFVNGYECTIQAGEALYMPAAIWHYVEYTTTGMSYNIRFGRNRYTRFFANAFHMNTSLQMIAWKMVDASVAGEKYAEVFGRLTSTYKKAYGSAKEKRLALQAVFDRIRDELYPESAAGDYAISDDLPLAEIYEQGAERLYSAVPGLGRA